MMIRLMLGLILLIPPLGFGAGSYQEITYEGSTEEGELKLGVTFTLWIPDSAEPLRGVIVHQHGCGVGASRRATCQSKGTASTANQAEGKRRANSEAPTIRNQGRRLRK